MEILTRESIAQDADRAAAHAARTRVIPLNPHEQGTEAHAIWKAAYERHFLRHAAPEADGSA